MCVTEARDEDDPSMDEGKCPGFSKYLYFLFAPTLVYKDNYPRYSLSTTLVDSADKSIRVF